MILFIDVKENTNKINILYNYYKYYNNSFYF